MSKIKKIDTQLKSSTRYAKPSREPNDGYFIERDPMDTFSSEGTVRYGEETDVDDI